MEHRVHEQWERRREDTSQKGISSDCWGGEFLERVDEVVQRCLEDGEESKAHADQAYHGCYPWDTFVGGPAEDEKAAWKKDRADHHWWEASFWDCFVVVLLEFFDVEFVVARKN